MDQTTPELNPNDALQETRKAVFRNAGGPGGVQDNLPLAAGPSLEEEAVAKVKRQQASTFGDKVQSMWRQDGIVDGIIAHHAGAQMLPQEGYNPFEDKEWKELSEGISDELLPHLYEARSPAHARYTRDLLLQKQEDQQRLADLGAWGTAGRFAFGAVMPDQILAGMVGGRVAQAVKWGRVAAAGRAAKAATTGGEALAAEARAASEAAKVIARDAKGVPLASGAAAGAAGNAAFEVVRQQYNFEDDSTSVLTAALMGAGLSVPFSLLHIKGQRNIAATAAKEAEALEALRASHAGEAITPRQAQVLDEVVTMNALVRDVETGQLDAATAEARLADFRKRLEQDAQSFLKDHGERLRQEADRIIAERFPGAIGPHKPAEGPTPTDKHKLMQAANREDAEWRRKRADDAKAAKATVDQDLSDPVKLKDLATKAAGREPTTMELAFLKADGKRKAKRAAARMEREALGKDADIEAAWAIHEAHNAAATTRATDEAFEGSDAARQREVEAAYTQRELQAAEAPEGAPVAAPVAAPAKPALEGQDVHWEGRSGDTLYGTVTTVREDGRLVVKGLDGQTYLVKRSDLDYDSPGFESTPAPAGFMARGSIGSGQIKTIEAVSEQATAFRNLRLDIFATLNRSENPLVKRLAFGLVKDPIQVDSAYAQGWTASEWKSHYRRTIAGRFYWEGREALREAVKARRLGFAARIRTGFDQEFYELVTRVTRGDRSVLANNADIAPMLQRASKAMREAYDDMYAEAVTAGVKGADTVTPQDFYVNRQWDVRKIRAAEQKHGKDVVQRLLADSIRIPGLTGDMAKAGRFLTAVKRLEFSPAMQDILLHARDMGTLRSELSGAGLGPADVDAIVDTMFEVKAKAGAADAGQAPNLKFRFDIDENHTLASAAGELRIADLLENDSRMLIDLYFNSMAGHTALAKQGITSKADWDTRMREVSDWFAENSTKTDAGKRDVEILTDVYKNITGRPMSTQDFSATNRIAGAFRGYTRSVMLGQLGFAAAFEMKQAAALFGVRAMFAHMPSLVNMLKAMRSGHVPSMPLARDIAHIAGFGNEMAMSYARHAEVDDGYAGRMLHGFEKASNTASHTVDILSGNAGITSMTRNWAGRMATQRFVDFANRPASLTPKWRERMVGWGIDDDDLDLVLDKLNQHTTRGAGGNVDNIRYEDWLRDSPETYEKFQLALSRAARDAIQDQDLGETAMFMHSTLGKVFGELRSFFLVAHAKNMLKNLHYRDATALQVWMLGLLGESMAYMTQTSANYAHDPEELANRLTLERISAAAFFRMASAGMAPALLDTLWGIGTGGDSLVQQGTTVATDNRSLLQTPSLVMAGRLTKAPATLGGILLGTDVTTQNEMRSLMGILPGSRLLGVSNAINALVELQPKYDPEKGR